MSQDDQNKSDGQQTSFRKPKFNRTCNYCGKFGHKKAECYSLKNRTENEHTGTAQVAGQEQKEKEFALATDNVGTVTETMRDIWIGDSGASCHMTYSVEGLHDLGKVVPEESITVGDGTQLRVTHIGNLRASIPQDDGSKKTIVLRDIKVVPKLKYKLFSILTAMKNDWDISTKTIGNTKHMVIKKGSCELVFDTHIPTGNTGKYLAGLRLKSQDVANVTTEEKKEIQVNVLHKRLGHVSEVLTRATGNYMGLELKGKMTKCTNCVVTATTGKIEVGNPGWRTSDRF